MSGEQNGEGFDRLYIVPADVSSSVIRDDGLEVDNVSLLLHRFAPFEAEKSGGTLKPSIVGVGVGALNGAVRNVIDEYRSYLQRYLNLVETMGTPFVMVTASRLVVGLGDESVYETSVRLLRNYGLPYIPGSAIKGVARAWAVEVMADIIRDKNDDFYEVVKRIEDQLENESIDAFPDDRIIVENASEELIRFARVFEPHGFAKVDGKKVEFSPRDIAELLVKTFGTIEEKGSAIFFDAFPVPVRTSGKQAVDELIGQLESTGRGQQLIGVFDIDIMNPHYGPYYQGTEAPGDWHSPVPVFFLTVRKGVPFVFGVAGNMSSVARGLIEGALRYHGVGAKTSLGYGRFR